MKFTNESSYSINGEKVSFHYIKKPTLSQRMSVVNDIVDGVINETAGYQPILFDYFTAVAFIVNLTDIELSQSFIMSSEMIEEAHLFKLILDLVDDDIVTQIINAAKEEIEYLKIKSANKSSLDDLAEALTMLVNKYSGMFDGLDVKAVSDNIAKIAQMSNMDEKDMIKNILKSKKEVEKTI